MSDLKDQPPESPSGRGRGRGRSRGGLGKYLRARGRGRGYGRPAEFGKRLVLGEEEAAELDEEEARELQQKYSRRQLGTNADRYKEPEPELDSEGEEIEEPEVDLSAFLQKQRLQDEPAASLEPEHPHDEEVDHSLAHISLKPKGSAASQPKKGRVQTIEWDERLEQLSRDRAAAEATWELKDRFRAKADVIRKKPIVEAQGSGRGQKQEYKEAPPLPGTSSSQGQKNGKEQLQNFLDDLLG